MPLTKYPWDLRLNEQLVTMQTFLKELWFALLMNLYTHKTLRPHRSWLILFKWQCFFNHWGNIYIQYMYPKLTVCGMEQCLTKSSLKIVLYDWKPKFCTTKYNRPFQFTYWIQINETVHSRYEVHLITKKKFLRIAIQWQNNQHCCQLLPLPEEISSFFLDSLVPSAKLFFLLVASAEKKGMSEI